MREIFEDKRKKRINNYILISQVLFFLLLGVLVLRVTEFSYEDVFVKMPTVVIMALLLGFVPLLQQINVKHSTANQMLHFAVISIYLFIAGYLLTKESGNIFKVIMLMPVVITALEYGIKESIAAGFLSTVTLFTVAYYENFTDIDGDILLSAVILLLAWLIGNMVETEKAIRSELEKLATHDSLTNIYNHRSFHYLLEQELMKAKQTNTRVSLLLIDIDYFKFYNDTYGHQKGDEVLKKIAGVLLEVIKERGYCARYGGAKFAVILPDGGAKTAKILGETIRERIETTRFPGEEVLPKGKLTVSVGIAEFPGNADSKERLIQNADEALYKAKFISKNRVETYYSVFDELSLSLKDNEKELFNSIRTLTMVINAKDRYTYGHSLRVMDMAKKLAAKLELDEKIIKDITYGALLHDIGKIEISREILNKPARLSEEEWKILKQHPQWGADIIRPLESIKGARRIILHHHENFDGSGYPHGLAGEAIPIGARIMRIIDSFDAICSNRPYKRVLSQQQAIRELEKYSGTYYDPEILELFKEMILKSRD